MNDKMLKIVGGAVGAIILLMAGIIGFLLNSNPQSAMGGAVETNVFNVDEDGQVLTKSTLVGMPLDNATSLSIATSSSGTLDADTYYFVVTSIDAEGGETAPSTEATCSPAGTEACVATMTINSNAASTRLWYGTETGYYIGYVSATSSVNFATTTSVTEGYMTRYNKNSAFDTVIDSTGVKTTPYGTYATGTVAVGGQTLLRVDANGNLVVSMGTALDEINDSITTHEYGYSYDIQAAPAANNVIKASAGKLHAVVVGSASSTATDIIEISDHATDGDGNVVLQMTDAPVGVYVVDMAFGTGITSDTTVQENVTFIYE